MAIKSADLRIQLDFGAALACLLALGIFSWHSIVVFNGNNLWVAHTHEVLDDLRDLGFSVKSIESSSGAFVLSGEESELAD